MSSMKDKIALVTGANRGLGFEIAKQLAKQGITVIMGVRDLARGKSAAAKLAQEMLPVTPVELDVSSVPSIKQALAEIHSEHGRIDILVNNAGILPDNGIPMSKLEPKLLSEVMNTNVVGPLILAQSCLSGMLQRKYGRIVNVSSTMGSLTDMSDPTSPMEGVITPAYRMSKAALNVITILLAKETHGTDVLINSACPGWVATDLGGPKAPISVADGADTPVWLATLPEGGPSGLFFSEREPRAW